MTTNSKNTNYVHWPIILDNLFIVSNMQKSFCGQKKILLIVDSWYTFNWLILANTEFDVENALHINWVIEKSIEYAKTHNIDGVTRSFVEGFIVTKFIYIIIGSIKHIIPSIASTQSVVACTFRFIVDWLC